MNSSRRDDHHSQPGCLLGHRIQAARRLFYLLLGFFTGQHAYNCGSEVLLTSLCIYPLYSSTGRELASLLEAWNPIYSTCLSKTLMPWNPHSLSLTPQRFDTQTLLLAKRFTDDGGRLLDLFIPKCSGVRSLAMNRLPDDVNRPQVVLIHTSRSSP